MPSMGATAMSTRQAGPGTESTHGHAARPSPTKAQQTRRLAKANGDASGAITAEDRWQLIALGAYFRAEGRGFAPGRECEDWFEAENEVEGALLGRGDGPDSV